MSEHAGALGARDTRGGVGRSVVHHQDVEFGSLLVERADDGRQRFLFVVGRDDGEAVTRHSALERSDHT
jgi:hypothetical protein